MASGGLSPRSARTVQRELFFDSVHGIIEDPGDSQPLEYETHGQTFRIRPAGEWRSSHSRGNAVAEHGNSSPVQRPQLLHFDLVNGAVAVPGSPREEEQPERALSPVGRKSTATPHLFGAAPRRDMLASPLRPWSPLASLGAKQAKKSSRAPLSVADGFPCVVVEYAADSDEVVATMNRGPQQILLWRHSWALVAAVLEKQAPALSPGAWHPQRAPPRHPRA